MATTHTAWYIAFYIHIYVYTEESPESQKSLTQKTFYAKYSATIYVFIPFCKTVFKFSRFVFLNNHFFCAYVFSCPQCLFFSYFTVMSLSSGFARNFRMFSLVFHNNINIFSCFWLNVMFLETWNVYKLFIFIAIAIWRFDVCWAKHSFNLL